ncbi:DEAD/DEAH box helicase family protein [Cohnella sp.]|uniref:TOTE conflict system archaeo-eukaryotic primase domain-containing protein n=1 Tax=Cohnella sp. TaxID=1883426 RepID=UPI0037038923
MDDIYQKYEAALREIDRLREENLQLKLQIGERTKKEVPAEHSAPLPDVSNTDDQVTQYSTVGKKLALYRSYFRGREDVYPIRWQNKLGKSGYSPVCGNEWTAVCHKPKIKCSACTHQNFLPLSDDVLSKHLNAREDRAIGIYPMLPDETCWFLAMDFDKKNWKEDAAAVMQVCRDNHIPAALERSRSGNGGHIWLFFSEPILASQARRIGTIILSLTMNHRYQIGLDSYDRLFPNQDTLPKGGFGNLIALPLQGGPRKQGNSVFIDRHFNPYEDQWRFLAEQGKLSEVEVTQFIQLHAKEDRFGIVDMDADSDDDKEPWTSSPQRDKDLLTGSLPITLKIILADRVYVEKAELPTSAINRLMRLASFSNPDFYKNQAMRLSTYGKPRVISCAEDLPRYIALPRGCLSAVQNLFEQNGVQVVVEDNRFSGSAIDARFDGELTMLQDTAAKAILAHDTGILSAATGFGKTVVASFIIASRKVNTLILVHRRELMEQWRERLQTFLGVPKEAIGWIGGGKNKRTNMVDIAVIQSLNRKGEVNSLIEEYGQVIVDECHHLSAFSFEQVLMKAKARYVFGLTATPKRQDGQEAIVMMQLGPVRIRVDAKMLTGSRGFSLSVVPRYTDFRLSSNVVKPSIQEVYQFLVDDEARNTLIFDDLLHCLEERRSPLLLVERRTHADYFAERLRPFAKNVIVLQGGMGKRQRDDIRAKMASISDDEERVFIATGKLIGEGFDDSRLDTLFLVHPISWTGTLQQYAGRLHRSHANKQEVKIYDYIDLQVPMLMSMYKKRIKGYRKMGYKGAEL